MTLHRVASKKGERLVYSVPSFLLSGYTISWGAFRLYTPRGDQTDGEDFKYIDVPGGSHTLSPHSTLRKACFVLSRVGTGLEVIEVLEGAENPLDSGIGLEGDIFIRAFVSPDSEGAAIHADVIEAFDDPGQE